MWSGASRTAEAVCYMRATDRLRPASERIVDDRYAELFLGPAFRAILRQARLRGAVPSGPITTYVLARHRFLDDALVAALEGGVEQVVLLGAGYDARPYRLREALGARPVLELDHPATARRKAALVARHGLRARGLRSLAVDLAAESLEQALSNAGFLSCRTFFVWEGVSMYLTSAQVESTLRCMRALAPTGSMVGMDFWTGAEGSNWSARLRRFSAGLLRLIGEAVLFGIRPEATESFFDALDLQLVDMATDTELWQRYVRDDRTVYPSNFVATAAW